MQMMSGGAVGGGISSSVARAIGGGRIHETAALVHHALAIAFLLGLVSAAVVLPFGPSIYRSMGASGASLGAALAYSNIVFGGIVLLWVLNALASLLRGSGNIAYPAAVICIGALILAAVSPVLIYGLGPFPRLGVAGAALAVVLYYAVGVVVLAARLASGRELVRLTLRGVHFQPEPFADILKVGAVSVLIASSMTLIVAVTNAVIGRAGPATLAGYGAASRLEYLALSLTFGLGVPVVAMVGTCIGAADRRRARRIVCAESRRPVKVTRPSSAPGSMAIGTSFPAARSIRSSSITASTSMSSRSGCRRPVGCSCLMTMDRASPTRVCFGGRATVAALCSKTGVCARRYRATCS